MRDPVYFFTTSPASNNRSVGTASTPYLWHVLGLVEQSNYISEEREGDGEDNRGGEGGG